jgi:glycosyltransferase involved in cell wall biosynthesis
MKTYKKRIAFLISDQHFIPHGGIGSFCKSFTEMCGRIGWKVDILLDKAPTGGFDKVIEAAGANIIWPLEPLRYSDHTATFAFSDTINFEKIINFRNSILEAFEENLYDMILCNTQEAMSAAYAMTLNKDIPVIFYTHLHSMIFRSGQGSDVFLDSYHNFYNKHMEFPDIFIGTQSLKNKIELESHGSKYVSILQMPLSERGLLEPSYKKRRGVLFIGRWEEGKNPEAYIKAMKESGLPCKVMTNSNGQKKFEKAFAENGITDYEIKAGITGQEKVDFIKSCAVFFMPSLRENFPFAFYECLGHMPSVVLDTQDWSENFLHIYYYRTNMDEVSDTLKRLHDTSNPEKYYKTGALEYVKSIDTDTVQSWIDFIDGYEGRKAKSNQAKINEYETVKYADYIKELNRKHLAREDFESVLTNRHKFNVIYTDNHTYLSKDATFVPDEEETNLFEGL